MLLLIKACINSQSWTGCAILCSVTGAFFNGRVLWLRMSTLCCFHTFNKNIYKFKMYNPISSLKNKNKEIVHEQVAAPHWTSMLWCFHTFSSHCSFFQFNGFQKGKNCGWVMNQLPVLLCHEHWTTPTTGTTASRPPACIAISRWGSAAGAPWPFTATTPGRSTPPPQAVHYQQHPGSHPSP